MRKRNINIFKPICHNIGHHAVSGLCYFPEHFTRDCLKHNIPSGVINLIGIPLLPENVVYSKETLLSAEALKEMFIALIEGENISADYIEKAALTFDIREENLKNLRFSCKSTLKVITGTTLEYYFSHDFFGKQYYKFTMTC